MRRSSASRAESANLLAHSSSSTLAAYGLDDLVFPRLLIYQTDDTFFCGGEVWCVWLDPNSQKFYFFRKVAGGSAQWEPPWLA